MINNTYWLLHIISLLRTLCNPFVKKKIQTLYIKGLFNNLYNYIKFLSLLTIY